MGGLLRVVAEGEVFGLHGSPGALLFGAWLSGPPNRVRRHIMPGIDWTRTDPGSTGCIRRPFGYTLRADGRWRSRDDSPRASRPARRA